DLSQVWIKLDAYESDLQWLRYGQTVEFTTVAYPGEVFTGTVAFIAPSLDPKTRTAKVRVNVPNADGRLKPEMFVKAVAQAEVAVGGKVLDAALAGRWICPMHPEIVKDEASTCDLCEMDLVTAESLGYVAEAVATEKPLVIPVSAALVTGTRAVVYVQKPDTEKPTFEGREIVLGPRAGDFYLVRSGLKEGELVVIRGNFKIDSALQILAKPSMMTPSDGGASDVVDAEALFRYQLSQILEAGQKVQSFLAQEDLDATGASFFGIQYYLSEVDVNALSGEALKHWNELSMRIHNDAVEGADASTLALADQAAQALASNLMQLQSRFGLDAPATEQSGPSLDATLHQQLDVLLQSYFALQQALADDSSDRTVTAARTMQQAVTAIDMSLFAGETHNQWMAALPILKESLTKIAASQDMQVQREGFYPLSQQIIGLSKSLGALGANTVFIMHCPMAFDNRGASWLQDNESLKNPYFGAMMLQCGSIEEVIPSR
ncbi:efflux RND transporter periplasmic adaptor subunit, partial [Planctomycetota bacterium]